MTGCIYGLFDSSRPLYLWECRYIGKTMQRPGRRLSYHRTESKTGKNYRCNWFRSVELAGNRVVMVVLETHEAKDNLALNDVLMAREVAWISSGRLQGWRLTNLTDGGEGAPGYRHTDDAKAKISAANGNPTPETRAKKSAALMGHKVSDDARAKMSAAALGNKNCVGRIVSEETRVKMSASLTGRKLTPEHIANSAAGNIGKRHSDETKAKMSESAKGNKSNLGRIFTPEHRARISAGKSNPSQETRDRMSAAQKESWVRRRAAKGASA